MSMILALLLAALARAEDPPEEPEEGAPEEDLELEEAAPAAAEAEAGWRLWLEPAVGLALPMGHPGVGSSATLGLGAQLPWLGGRLLPGVQVGGSAWGVNDTLVDGLAEPYDWHLSVRRFTVAPLLRARLRPAGRLGPELGAAVEFHRGVVESAGERGGAPLGASWEQASWAGWMAEAALAGALGPGEGRLSLAWHGERLAAAATGDVYVGTLVFALGYRVRP